MTKVEITKAKVAEMMVILVSLSDDSFQECISYMKNEKMSQKERDFFELALHIASKKRAEKGED